MAYPWLAEIFSPTPKFWGLKKPELIGRLPGLSELKFGTGYETSMPAEPDLDGSCTEVAVQVALPAPDGVRTPADVMVPPVAVQVMALS